MFREHLQLIIEGQALDEEQMTQMITEVLSGDITDVSHRIAEGSAGQTSAVDTVSSSIEEMNSSIKSVVQSVEKDLYGIGYSGMGYATSGVRKVPLASTDDGAFFELQEDYATHLVTGFARFGGHVVGIAANNPDEMSGVFEIDSADKYDRFIMFLDAFNIPLLTLVDSTAYVPGDKWERLGIIRHGAKNLLSYSHLTTQKITIVLRRAYGGTNIVMGCAQMNPDFVLGWPTGEFAPTGPETVVEAVFHKELAKAKEQGNYQQLYDSMVAVVRTQMSVLTLSQHWTSYYMLQEAIDPRDTRPVIIKALEATANKHEELPLKRRYIKPA